MREMQSEFQAADVTIAIPTYGREQVLLDTVQACLDQESTAGEILIIDQTPSHEARTEEMLSRWAAAGQIRVVQRSVPSVPQAMNQALCDARNPIVLFIDDDVVLKPNLVRRHASAHVDPDVWAVVGQVLQPGEQPIDWTPRPPQDGSLTQDLEFRFNSARPAYVHNCMAGNLSVRRDQALKLGGFDENFRLRIAYRFETDFARRIWEHGGKILFEPSASLRHLRASSGGTRTAVDFLRSPQPDHSIGDYYFALRHGTRAESFAYITRRFVRSVATRYHLRHPWWIPSRLVGELRGLIGARRLARREPRLIGDGKIAEALQVDRATCK
jgi:GT2 family glycosyltransferase